MYDHYVAVDWAMSNMAIARMTPNSKKPMVIDVPSSISELKIYLKNLQGSICLTVEETTTAQWLYTELRDSVDRLIVCDPFRNKLLSEGAKTDKIDAEKLVKLLRGDLLKEVFHSTDKYVSLRKLVSAYEDLIQQGVRMKNQRAAIFRSYNLNSKKIDQLNCDASKFVLTGLDEQIEKYNSEKKRYLTEFVKIEKDFSEVKRLKGIPGIGDILAIQIVARVIDAKRFKTRSHFLSYCGLVKLDKISGGKTYGKRSPRFCRRMKQAFKIAASASIYDDNEIARYYQFLINEKKYPAHNARNAVARKIATYAYGVMKNGNNYNPKALGILSNVNNN